MIAKKVFLNPLKELLNTEEITLIFSNIEFLFSIHKQLLEEFENTEDITLCIGEKYLRIVI